MKFSPLIATNEIMKLDHASIHPTDAIDIINKKSNQFQLSIEH